jgi:hypothetical protein
MAKLFQTRLKIEEQSTIIAPFNVKIEQGSTTPHADTFRLNQGEGLISKIQIRPDQGESTISKPSPIKYDTSRQISVDVEKSKADYLVLRQSNLLRYNLPTILPTLSPGLSTIPTTPNTIFSDRVNLENRIKQAPITGTTVGLSLFFLSDFYANRLPDIHYNFTPNQGSVIIQSLLYTPTQGSITINNISFAPIQGSIVINPLNFTPNQGSINITPFIFESLPHQGTTTSNAITTSVISVFPFNFLPNQGETTIGLYNPTINQDAFTVLGSTTTLDQIQINQGITFDSTGALISFLLPNFILPNPTQGSTDPTLINFNPEQGLTDPTLINYNPTQGTAALNVASIINTNILSLTKPKDFHGEANLSILKYELDRLLARTLPEVKHGSSEKTISNFNPNQGSVTPTNYIPQFETQDQSNLVEGVATITTEGIQDSVIRDDTGKVLSVPRDTDSVDRINNYITNANSRNGVLDPNFNAWQSRKNSVATQHTQALNRKTKDENSDAANDYVTLSFTSVRDGNTIAFKSYITSLSDNWSPTYADIKYVGRQDTLKVFNGVTRNISLGFKIPSDSVASHTAMYNKLQSLIRASVIGENVAGKPYIVGPMMKVTIGNYVTNTPCVVNSLKIDTNPSEYPWEITSGRELPHFLDVSMDFFILGDNSGNTTNKNGTFISIAS